MVTHVLIIYRELPFAISIKQALERTGNYEVHPFVTPSAALEYLAQNPHDVVIVDFKHPQDSGASLVSKVRGIQADVAIIATPRQDDRVLNSLSLNGSINAPFTARDIMPIINKAIEVTGRTGRITDGDAPSKPTRKLSREEMPPTTPNAVTRQSPNRPPDLPEYTPLQSLFGSELTPEPEADVEDFLPPEMNFEDFSIFEEEEEEADFVITPEDLPPRPVTIPSKLDTSELFADMIDSGMLTEAEPEDDDAIQPSVDDLTFDLPLEDIVEPDTDDLFTGVLGQIKPDDVKRKETDQFDTLVNSMRPPQDQRPPLTARQVEFTFGGDMDDLLSEIERQRKETTSNLPEVPEGVLDIDAVPDAGLLDDDDFFTTPLEEAGTVSDLVESVSDPSFRGVLAALRGEEVIEEEESDSVVYSSRDLQDAFAPYYESGAAAPSKPEPAERRPPKKSPLTEEVDSLFAEVEAELRQPSEMFIEEPEGANTAKLVLENTEDESFSISELITSIEKQLPEHRPKVQPLPSWVKEGKAKKDKRRKTLDEDAEKFVAEPDFLPEFPPEPEPSDVYEFDTSQFIAGIDAEDAALTVPHAASDLNYLEAEVEESAAESGFTSDDFDMTTMPGRNAGVVEKPGDLETESLRFSDQNNFDEAFDNYDDEDEAPRAPSSLPEFEWGEAVAEAIQEIGPTHEPIVERFDLLEEDTPQFSTDLVPEPDEVEPEVAISPYATQHIDDPYIAQLALSLTDVSLELTAEATLLTREGEIVAYAGRMPGEEIDELRAAIHDDWDAKPDEARIRFINLPASGKDFMLYSRRTDDELTLSLIFAGSTHLRDIQRQGKRIIEALRAVPDPATLAFEAEIRATMEAVPELTAEQQALARAPYAYLWLLRDPNAQLNDRMAKAIVAGMNLQLRQEAWLIDEIRASEDYVYLVADVPGETPPYEVIRDLKRRAADIVIRQNPQLDPASIWADSYLIVTPGRKLDEDEIKQFIEFERMM